MAPSRILSTILSGILPMLIFGPAVWADEPVACPETVMVLVELERNEIIAHRSYVAFARQAVSEELFSIARLFVALQFSESIHARNFRDNLRKIGADVPPPEFGTIEVETTRINLKKALSVELAEIDNHYPEYLAKIQNEAIQSAIDDITFAWKAEQQHRDLLKKMKSALPFFFGQIDRKLDQAERYFVCRRCGSTLAECPAQVCPICGREADRYVKIESIVKFLPETVGSSIEN